MSDNFEQNFSDLLKKNDYINLDKLLSANEGLIKTILPKTEIYISMAINNPTLDSMETLLVHGFIPQKDKLAVISAIKKKRFDVLVVLKQYSDYIFDEDTENEIKKVSQKKKQPKESKKSEDVEQKQQNKKSSANIESKQDDINNNNYNDDSDDFFEKKEKKQKANKETVPGIANNDLGLLPIETIEEINTNTITKDDSDDFFEKKTKKSAVGKEEKFINIVSEKQEEVIETINLIDSSDGIPLDIVTAISDNGEHEKSANEIIHEAKEKIEHLNTDIIKELHQKIARLENEILNQKEDREKIQTEHNKSIQEIEAEKFKLVQENKDIKSEVAFYKNKAEQLEKELESKILDIKDDLLLNTSTWEDSISAEDISKHSSNQFVDKAGFGSQIELLEIANSMSSLSEEVKFYALIAAIDYSRRENVLDLIYKYKVNINLNSSAALVRAVNKDEETIVKLLIQNGANISLGKYQILEEYIKKNNIDMVKELLLHNAIPFDETNRFLMTAIDHNHTEIIKLLLINKAPFLDRDGEMIPELAKNKEIVNFIKAYFD